MPRPSIAVPIALSLFAAFSLSACKTIYTDMYQPRRNHFKPVKDNPKPSDVLPAPKPVDATLPVPGAAPGAAPGLEPLPAGGAPAAPAPAAPAPPPAIPGL